MDLGKSADPTSQAPAQTKNANGKPNIVPITKGKAPSELVKQWNALIAFLGTMNGRDKFYRGAQFFLKAVAWFLERYHPLREKNACSDVLNKMANGFGLGRRFVRIGNMPATIQGIQQSARDPDPWLSVCGVLSKTATLVFLFLDHASWISRQGVFAMNYDYWSYWESLCWLLSVWFMVLADTYVWLQVSAQRAALLARLRDANASELDSLCAQLDALREKRTNLILNYLRNFSDLPIALNGMYKYKSISPIVWHLLGLNSSIIGSYQTWPSTSSK
jgi:hypothetical protein